MASAASVDFLSHLLGPNRQYPSSDNAAFLEFAYLALQAKSTKGSFTRKTNSIDFAYLSTLQQMGAGMTLTQAFQTVFIDPEYDSYLEAQTENANLKDWSKSTRRPANFLVCDNVDVERKIKGRLRQRAELGMRVFIYLPAIRASTFPKIPAAPSVSDQGMRHGRWA